MHKNNEYMHKYTLYKLDIPFLVSKSDAYDCDMHQSGHIRRFV